MGRAPREKRHTSSAGSTSASAELDSPEGSLIREGEEYHCPFCYSQSFDVAGLIDHVNQEHAYQQRSARCPVCNKPVRDVLQHLSVHHQDAEECSSPSSQASSSMSQSMSMEWARAVRQEEDMLLKLKAAAMSSGPSAYKQTSLTDKHGRLKHSAERAQSSSSADQAVSRAVKPSASDKQALGPAPKPAVVDTPELRAQFIREMLLSAFEIDKRL